MKIAEKFITPLSHHDDNHHQLSRAEDEQGPPRMMETPRFNPRNNGLRRLNSAHQEEVEQILNDWRTHPVNKVRKV